MSAPTTTTTTASVTTAATSQAPAAATAAAPAAGVSPQALQPTALTGAVQPGAVLSVPIGTAAFAFGRIAIDAAQVFYATPLSYATVNLKPVLPGHVLVLSRRVVARVSALTPAELLEMWVAAQRIARMLAAQYPSSAAFTFAVQDGAAAGQTVPHVHIHVLPRRTGDFARNDDVYEALEADSKQQQTKAAAATTATTAAAATTATAGAPAATASTNGTANAKGAAEDACPPHTHMDELESRPPRTAAEMAAEARLFREGMKAFANS